MPRRTRSLLIDASLGKIFAGAADTASATAAHLVAGTRLKSILCKFGSRLFRASLKNDVITSVPFPDNAVITAVKIMVNTLQASYMPTGCSIIVRLKTGLTYATSTSVGNVSLPALTTSATTATSISIPAGYTLYWDIIQVGSAKAGTGLSITPFYYIGY
jgi:hypothetical protein